MYALPPIQYIKWVPCILTDVKQSFLAAYLQHSHVREIEQQFNPTHPLLTRPEAIAQGPYAWFVVPTGAVVSFGLIPTVCMLALPIVRRSSFDLFYYSHIVGAIATLVFACIHASTNFYCLLPGLALWLTDWMSRIFHSLNTCVEATIENAGNDWYRIHIKQSHGKNYSETSLERGEEFFRASPIVTYYLNFGEVSRLQLHPFTAAKTGDDMTGPTFLFRKCQDRDTQAQSAKEWTWKVAALADSRPGSHMALKVQFPPSDFV